MSTTADPVDPGDWVRDAVTTDTISAVGDVFVMNIDARGCHCGGAAVVLR